MGTKVCCQQTDKSNQDQIDIQIVRNPKSQNPSEIKQPIVVSAVQPTVVHQQIGTVVHNPIPVYEKPVTIPTVSQVINQYLQKNQPFSDKISNNHPIKSFNGNVYQGELNNKGQPNGYGTMYYANGNVLVGQFKDGHVDGKAHYIWKDGSYYQGKVEKSLANDENGLYHCQSYTYRGNIKNNQMTGYGTLQGDRFKYKGRLQNGRKKQGELQWKQNQNKNLPGSSSVVQLLVQYKYQGKFDENQNFTDQGVLTSEKGVYRGKFFKGVKQGKGVFQYKNGLKYQGDYKNDQKEGHGTIYSKQKVIVYTGEIKNGLPHGKGQVPTANGQMAETQWVNGLNKITLIQSNLLEQ